jgi:hypothetical protein
MVGFVYVFGETPVEAMAIVPADVITPPDNPVPAVMLVTDPAVVPAEILVIRP